MANEDIIDLTGVDTSDDEVSMGGQNEMTNRKRIVKFTFVKRTRSSRLQLVRPGMAEKIHFSCFSESSQNHFWELENGSKRTYVGESTNPFCGGGLFAAERIEPGEFICLYRGYRMSWPEACARMDGNYCSDYMLYVTDGVVIDGKGIGMGAAMANHSCLPNSELQYDHLRGSERAPIGLLRAVRRIEVGDEILTSYNMWDPVIDGMPDLNDLNSYVPCRCLSVNCCLVLKRL
ncbi:MAG: SET domain-containing protein [Chloroflexota bacterium]